MAQQDYTPHQEKIIKRYYDNQEVIQCQRLAELVGDLYLAEGKKKDRLWQQAGEAMAKLGVPASRIDHVLKMQKPELLALVVQELEGK